MWSRAGNFKLQCAHEVGEEIQIPLPWNNCLVGPDGAWEGVFNKCPVQLCTGALFDLVFQNIAPSQSFQNSDLHIRTIWEGT